MVQEGEDTRKTLGGITCQFMRDVYSSIRVSPIYGRGSVGRSLLVSILSFGPAD